MPDKHESPFAGCHPDHSSCPASIEEMLLWCGLDPVALGDDWLDIVAMVGEAEANRLGL